MIKTALKNRVKNCVKKIIIVIKKMSFLKISDPTNRDQTVKEYLELKKNIRDNLLSDRNGEQQLQTELTKFYRPITESQKATAREITEGLKPIREGIENLPQAMQPIGEASGEEASKKFEEEEDESVGDIANKFLRLDDKIKDKTFGINKIDGHHYIGDTHVIIHKNNIIIDDEKFIGTPTLWSLIMLKDPPPGEDYTRNDMENYIKILFKTHVLYQGNNPNNPYPKSSKSSKWNRLLSSIWENRKTYEGKGVFTMPSDPNALLERLDLLLASQEAGHTGVGNELVSICDELKRQGVLDTKTYKKLNSIIKK